MNQAYVGHKQDPDIEVLVFAEDRNQAKRRIADILECSYTDVRLHRIPDLDQYGEAENIPESVLREHGFGDAIEEEDIVEITEAGMGEVEWVEEPENEKRPLLDYVMIVFASIFLFWAGWSLAKVLMR